MWPWPGRTVIDGESWIITIDIGDHLDDGDDRCTVSIQTDDYFEQV